MTVSHILTAALQGLEAVEVVAEVDMANSLPGISIVGLPDAAVNESKERIRSAIKNSSYNFPVKKVVINLAPADLKKEGSGFDLPMAVGILGCSGVIDVEKTKGFAFCGELSLDGRLRAVNGILPIVASLKNRGVQAVILPEDNVKEAALVSGIDIYPAEKLGDVVSMFCFEEPKLLPRYEFDSDSYLSSLQNRHIDFDFKDIKGQKKAKRALLIAAAGGHNILMSGAPGAGKTLLSKCFAGILPPLSIDEAIELTKIYSISGLIDRDKPLVSQRPFRSPHHSASSAGIIGGGSSPKPGEITLAHHGVLFLDEVVEFPRSVLEVLRQPLEDGVVTISRAMNSVKYPADFILLAAMNPCPCGYFGDTKKQCTCSASQVQRYVNRLSGPLLDRIDLQIDVPRLSEEELLDYSSSQDESSESMRLKVISARDRQKQRFKSSGIRTNSQMNIRLIKKYCKLDERCEGMMRSAIAHYNLSGRAFDRILKLSRTIADLAGAEDISFEHLAEALQYRTFSNNIF